MKIKFHHILIYILLSILILVEGCKLFNEGNDEPNNGNKSSSENSISSEYWGTWIRMDTGDEYYIDSSSIKKKAKYSYYSDSEVSRNTNGYSFDGENILKNGNIIYFRKGGKFRDFSVKVAGFSDIQARALDIGKNGIPGRRRNKENNNDTETVISSTDGTLNFTDAVAGDTHEITVADTTKVEITPNYNGEDLGTIPIVEDGTYGFKTTYSIDGDEQNFCYGNYYKTYNLKLNINNIGSKICSTSVYSISYSDSQLNIIKGDLTGNFSSIESGKSKEVSLSVRYGKLEEEFVDVPIRISITDSVYNRTWEDSVTIRFYKGAVNLKVNSRNFDANSSAKLNGFLIYPDGRSKRFSVSQNSDSVVLVPWSKYDYKLAFSGATLENEMAYSFGFSDKTNLADLTGTWNIAEINAYESNDSISTAYRVTDLSKPVKAYLKYGDIDFYIINCKGVDVSFKPVSIVNFSVKEYENGNNDDIVTAGESLYLDVKMKNSTNSTLSGISLNLSTSSSYVNLVRNSYKLDEMKAGYYYSLTDYASNESSCYLMYSSYYSSRAFKFSVSNTCPVGTELPFTVTFTDSSGYTWTDSFSVKVNSTQAKINLVSNTKYAIKDSENVNNNYVTPGKTVFLDIKANNSGKSTALGVVVTLSSSSDYVNLIRKTYNIGDMTAGYYYSLTDHSSGESSCFLMYSSYYSSQAFKFSVSDTCPVGTKLPFTVTFTDSSGNTWNDSLSIPVNQSN